MEFIASKNRGDCAVCALASFARISYEEALEILHPKFKKGKVYKDYATSDAAILRSFKKLNIKIRKRESIRSFKDMNDAYVIVEAINVKYEHVVVWNASQQSFYDNIMQLPLDDNWRIKEEGKSLTPKEFYRKKFVCAYEIIP